MTAAPTAQEQTDLALRMWNVAELAMFDALVRNLAVAVGLAEGGFGDPRPAFLRETFADLRRAVRGPALILTDN